MAVAGERPALGRWEGGQEAVRETAWRRRRRAPGFPGVSALLDGVAQDSPGGKKQSQNQELRQFWRASKARPRDWPSIFKLKPGGLASA